MPIEANITTPDYKVNYNDNRFAQVEADKNAALDKMNASYDQMINGSDQFYQAQIDATKQWADKQTQLQQQQSDFAIEKIEQQKAQAQKDYQKEQSGAFVDWQKQSDKYGANAEQMAAAGVAGSGYSESAQVAMYNTYQNRVAMAKESVTRAVLNYDNAIKEAMLQNNTVLAEIAFKALQDQLELSLTGFQQKNTLIMQKAEAESALNNQYYQRWQDVLSQINQENAMAEQIRQHNQELQLGIDKYNNDYKLDVAKYNEGIRQYEEGKTESAGNEFTPFALGDDTNTSGTVSITENGGVLESKAVNAVNALNNNTNNTTNTKDLPLSTRSAIAHFGTFDNGYQPRGIDGHGKVEKSGDVVDIKVGNKTITQNIWKTSDGKMWYWDSTANKYEPVKNVVVLPSSTSLQRHFAMQTESKGWSK